MFTLVGDSIPTTREQRTGLDAPAVFRLWQGNDQSAPPAFRIDPFGNFLQLNFTPVESGLGTPVYFGRLHQFTFDFTVLEIENGTHSGKTFNYTNDATEISPGAGYFYDTGCYLYADKGNWSVTTGGSMVFTMWGGVNLPFAINGIHVIDLSNWDSATVTAVKCYGINFTDAVNPLDPQAYEFVQDGDTLSLYPGTSTFPAFSAVLIKVTLTKTISAPVLSVASFDLSRFGVELPDQLDWMGHAFEAAVNLKNLRQWQFLWKNPWATLLLPTTVWVTPETSPSGSGLQPISSTTYESKIE